MASTSRADDCREGMRLSVGDDCTYPGTDERFTVNDDGDGSLGFITSGSSIYITDSSINGQVINFEADKQPDGTWLINRVG